MTSVLKKGKRKIVREYLWDYFHLIHEHYGYENCESIDTIYKHTLEFCERKNIVKKTDKINAYWRDKFKAEISSILYELRQKYNTYISPSSKETVAKKNKYYLRGFQCLNKNGKGHYFYPKNNNEMDEIEQQDKRRVENKTTIFEIRKLERSEYIQKQLGDGREIV